MAELREYNRTVSDFLIRETDHCIAASPLAAQRYFLDHDSAIVRDGDGLAEIAERGLGHYERSGQEQEGDRWNVARKHRTLQKHDRSELGGAEDSCKRIIKGR